MKSHAPKRKEDMTWLVKQGQLDGEGYTTTCDDSLQYIVIEVGSNTAPNQEIRETGLSDKTAAIYILLHRFTRSMLQEANFHIRRKLLGTIDLRAIITITLLLVCQ
jgi:hypothetical protein